MIRLDDLGVILAYQADTGDKAAFEGALNGSSI